MKKSFLFLVTLTLFFLPASALAKGPFTYLTIKGPGLIGELNTTHPALLDFFAFADFSKGSVEAPLDPGEGYEIVRSFVDSETNQVQNFDVLHYYPDSGYVYYDGLIGGSSEYDGKWYKARPEVETEFRAVLAERARLTWIPFIVLITGLVIFFVAYRAKPQSSIENLC